MPSKQNQKQLCDYFMFMETQNTVFEISQGLPYSSDGKESACNAEDPGSIPGSGRSLGEGNSNPVQYSCLENSMDKGAWWASPWGRKELDTTE